MRILYKGDVIEIIEANEELATEYYEFLKDLAEDDDSYVLTNYSISPPDLAIIRERAKSWNKGIIYMHFAFNGKRMVGYCGQKIGPSYGAEFQPHVSEIWYAISRDLRGKGLIYALILKSLQSVNVKYIQAYVDTKNIRSIKLLENLGFSNIAMLNENILNRRNGATSDEYLFRGSRDRALNLANAKVQEKGLILI